LRKVLCSNSGIRWQPLRFWFDDRKVNRSTAGVALVSENLLESVDVQKRTQKAFSGKIVAGD
jgi:hypothetical protein